MTTQIKTVSPSFYLINSFLVTKFHPARLPYIQYMSVLCILYICMNICEHQLLLVLKTSLLYIRIDVDKQYKRDTT